MVPDVTNKSNDINVFTTPKPVTAKRKFKKNKNNVSEHSLVTRSRSVLLNEKGMFRYICNSYLFINVYVQQ